ncbi:Parvulin-like PPIase [Sphingomonas antarctica]|uniref:peptidylprolyl isomerase n=1 Tax=Sphingomonas antarctica TaxID=2040274 RepID=UPI0039E78C4E
MLKIFRKYLTSPPVLALFAVIMLAFIVTGVGGSGGIGNLASGTGGGVAKAGSISISEVEVERRAKLALDSNRAQNPTLDMAGFVAGGGVDEVLDQLVNGRAVEEFAAANGMVASKKLVDGQIASIPAFNGPTGQFDRNTFLGVLSQRKINEGELRADFAREALTRQLLIPVSGGARMPANLVAPYAALLVERRDGKMASVPTAAFASLQAPTDAELTAFYRTNLKNYTVPERRILRYAVFDRTSVGADAVPTEAEIAADYKSNAQLYGASQTRGITQAVIADQAAANAVFARIKGGASFADALKPLGLEPLTLPPTDRAGLTKISGDAVAAAVFAAPKGAVGGPLRSPLGFVVFRVDQVVDKAAKTLAVARTEIVTRLTTKKANDLVADRVAKMQDAIDGGATFDDVAKTNGLTVSQSPALTATATDPDNVAYKLPPEYAGMVRDAFGAEPDDDPQVATIADGKFAFWKLEKVVPSAARPFAMIRDGLLVDYKIDRAKQAAKRVADTIAAAVNSGTRLAQAVAAAGVKLPPVQPLGGRRLEILRDQGRAPPPLALMFAIAPGRAKTLAAPNNGGWVVVTVDKVEPGNLAEAGGLVQSVQQALSRSAGDEYVQQFMNAVRTQVGVKRDASKISAVKRSLAGGAQ